MIVLFVLYQNVKVIIINPCLSRTLELCLSETEGNTVVEEDEEVIMLIIHCDTK